MVCTYHDGPHEFRLRQVCVRSKGYFISVAQTERARQLHSIDRDAWLSKCVMNNLEYPPVHTRQRSIGFAQCFLGAPRCRKTCPWRSLHHGICNFLRRKCVLIKAVFPIINRRWHRCYRFDIHANTHTARFALGLHQRCGRWGRQRQSGARRACYAQHCAKLTVGTCFVDFRGGNGVL